MSSWKTLAAKLGTAAVLVASAVPVLAGSSGAAAAPKASAYPAPGTSAASPLTGISFRGVTPAALGQVQVAGSVSGPHPGTLVAQRDGLGATFTPRRAFTPGETVTVRTAAVVTGARSGVFTFTVARPGRHPGVLFAPGERAGRAGPPLAGPSTTSALTAAPPTFRTRPDLRPPGLSITVPASGTAPGQLLATPYSAPGHGGGPMIFDNAGQLQWFRPSMLVPGDLKVLRYGGQDVLSWFEGGFGLGPGNFRGQWYLVDNRYQPVATIRAGNGYQADLHDLILTPAGTAYIDIYNPVVRDLRPYGGPANATVLELVLQEVDVATRAVLWEWHSLDHIPLTESYFPPGATWDYIHANSIEVDTDGNLIVSARHTSTVYKIDRTGGSVLWRLGGKRSDFRFVNDPANGISFQHDARRLGDGTLSLFDNGNQRQPPYSRAIRYQLDVANHTATLVESIRHRPDLYAFSQGGSQDLPAGHRFVSWGDTGVATEYAPGRPPVFEVAFPDTASYRMVRQVWHGRPTDPPDVFAVPAGAGAVTVYVSWNGATDVASWQVQAGPDADHLATIGTAPRRGFETAIPLRTLAAVVRVRALDAAGAVMGTSAVVPGSRWFAESRPASASGSYVPLVGDFGGTANDDIFWYAPGPGPEFRWLWNGSGGLAPSGPVPPVNGSYRALVGDFVGDAKDEILWWQPGATSAFMWRFDVGSTPPPGGVVPVPASVTSAVVLRNKASLGGAQHAEILWYAAGSAPDRVDRYAWPAGGSAAVVSRPVSVGGTYSPVSGDFDGNGWADVMWYAPGPAPDYVTLFTGDPATGSTGERTVGASVGGTYYPVVGRYGRNADQRDDIIWYAPGPGNDYLAESAGNGTFSGSSVSNSLTGTPVRLRGAARDDIMLWPGGDGTIWASSPYGMQLRPAGNTPIPVGYHPVVGAFTGTADVSSIFWYAAGPAPEVLFRPLVP